MNATIIHKQNVKGSVLDELSRELPTIIADVLEVPGGKLAIVLPEQVSLAFSQASSRDVGSDIKISIFAKRNDQRLSSENGRAKAILEKVVTLIATLGEQCSVDTRLYLLEIGVAEFH